MFSPLTGSHCILRRNTVGLDILKVDAPLPLLVEVVVVRLVLEGGGLEGGVEAVMSCNMI
jgi:hypothetical protein